MKKEHDLLYVLEHNIPYISAKKDEMYRDTIHYQEKFKFQKDSNPNYSTWNNEADAFKHTYMQAYSTYIYGEKIAKDAGNLHERNGSKYQGQLTGEENMDKWNNAIGRQIGNEVKNELKYTKSFFTEQQIKDMIAVKVMEKMRNGELITKPEDPRKYEDFSQGNPTGYATPIEPFTREQIGAMTPEEFAKNEPLIMEQLRNGQISSEKNKNDDYQYTREDIAGMSSKEYEKHEKDIINQMNTKGIPSKNDLPKVNNPTILEGNQKLPQITVIQPTVNGLLLMEIMS